MKENPTTKNVAIRSVNDMLRLLRENKPIVNLSTTEELDNENEARLIFKAENYVNDFIKENGTKSFISERLRDGYIGELIHTKSGSYIQSVRGKPYGTVVALKSGEDIVLGMSYVDPEDINKGHSIVGLYIALKRAVDGLKEGKIRAEAKYIKSRSRKQIEHFEKRALAYFHPDKYSHSRGSNPVKYENYDEIHKRRAMILGEEK